MLIFLLAIGRTSTWPSQNYYCQVVHLDVCNTQIHQRLIESAVWSKHLDSFSWRIDVKTRSRHIDQLNQPTAIMEMNLKSDKVIILVEATYCLYIKIQNDQVYNYCAFRVKWKV